MGCGVSMDTSSVNEEPQPIGTGLLRWQQQNGEDSANIVQEFVRLDEHISKLEASCPGPRLATSEAWIEHLQAKLNGLLGVAEPLDYAFGKQLQQQQQQQQQSDTTMTAGSVRMNVSEMTHLDNYDARHPTAITPSALRIGNGNGKANANANSNVFIVQQHQPANGFLPHHMYGATNGVGVERHANNIMASTPNRDLVNLALNLDVVNDARKASTHEDFFAHLSESAMHMVTIQHYIEILEHTKVRLKRLIDAYADLNALYVDHDGIIAFISGGTYMSRLEENLDLQLETARDVRDKLGSTMEQWRICGLLLRACANAATQALQQWRLLTKVVNPKDKLQIALECRNSLQASLISLDSAQLALPHVEVKHVSNRQILAVQHCNTYMITDIANVARYQHTSKVLAAYECNMSKATTWFFETFKKTLRQDFEKSEETVRNLAKALRGHREEIFTAARK